MSLLSNNKKDAKKGGKGAKPVAGAKPVVKAGNTGGFSKKPVKTGGTRGS